MVICRLINKNLKKNIVIDLSSIGKFLPFFSSKIFCKAYKVFKLFVYVVRNVYLCRVYQQSDTNRNTQ